MFYLYILKSKNKNYSYVGVTNNLERRTNEHSTGLNKTTKPYMPFIVVHKECYKTLSEARKREWFLKCTPQGGKVKRKILAAAAVAAPEGA
jgi:putative endonuclease